MALLKATKREGTGKYIAFAIRKTGSIPGVVYGKGMKENINITLNLKEFLALLKSGDRIIDLDVDGAARHVLIKAVQHGTYDHEILHADFRAISDDEVIDIELDIEVTGEAPGVALGGVLEQSQRRITVRCLPKNLPEHISLDVSGLNIGETLYGKELPQLKGVEYIFHGNPAIVSCHHPMSLEVESPTAEGTEPAAPEVIGEKEREAKAKEKEAGGDKKK